MAKNAKNQEPEPNSLEAQLARIRPLDAFEAVSQMINEHIYELRKTNPQFAMQEAQRGQLMLGKVREGLIEAAAKQPTTPDGAAAGGRPGAKSKR